MQLRIGAWQCLGPSTASRVERASLVRTCPFDLPSQGMRGRPRPRSCIQNCQRAMIRTPAQRQFRQGIASQISPQRRQPHPAKLLHIITTSCTTRTLHITMLCTIISCIIYIKHLMDQSLALSLACLIGLSSLQCIAARMDATLSCRCRHHLPDLRCQCHLDRGLRQWLGPPSAHLGTCHTWAHPTRWATCQVYHSQHLRH
mmetsp:Transcript_70628/g.169247  ORF Transcript_70628/g.169247 Transcript_70628/m.169247 type:complete len:201 (-) Transcript_70628:252-854(-)